MTRLLLVRHGESTANLNNVFAGHYDPQLTELGHRQAECTGRFVLGNYKVSGIYSSDLHRAFDTAQHFADIAGLAVIPEPRLREIYAGEWEEMSFSEVEQTYAEDWNRWRVDPANAVCTGGESVRQLADRVFAAVQEIAKITRNRLSLWRPTLLPSKWLCGRSLAATRRPSKISPGCPTHPSRS